MVSQQVVFLFIVCLTSISNSFAAVTTTPYNPDMDGLINSGPGELNQPEDTDHLLESEEDEFPQKSGMYNPMHDIFPGVNDDYTKISWIHAVNSQDKLAAALKGEFSYLLRVPTFILKFQSL
ncbi:uncharacterized protein LOC103511080 [Diaphorina citri]|uniref:Uncharacterized protein LOC103511080 n=1 Tax=Diaphorina citri TaxID=121845 RepID=A0A3Q0IWX9_DIACI|nr:uncharacterized protein LOC103511080 [Diaphorina citri]XP_026680747.1 uncharacterized protein LOC103511080 [Diaphorina citri]XP_026680748.1 uncharacterized protein LOC103511080 [Diaphorina citri]